MRQTAGDFTDFYPWHDAGQARDRRSSCSKRGIARGFRCGLCCTSQPTVTTDTRATNGQSALTQNLRNRHPTSSMNLIATVTTGLCATLFLVAEAHARRGRHGSGEDPFPELTYYVGIVLLGLFVLGVLGAVWNRIRQPSRDSRARQDAARRRADKRAASRASDTARRR